MEQIIRRIVIKGHVQGVMFRVSCARVDAVNIHNVSASNNTDLTVL